MKEKKHTSVPDLVILAVIITLIVICSGCATKSRHLDISGAYLNQAGTVAIGSIEVQSAPEGVESAMVSYEDSAAWFSDVKEHRIRILLTGTNSVTAADGIVSNICAAFTATAPALSPAGTADTSGGVVSGGVEREETSRTSNLVTRTSNLVPHPS